jgi:hypothetical protein
MLIIIVEYFLDLIEKIKSYVLLKTDIFLFIIDSIIILLYKIYKINKCNYVKVYNIKY